MASCAQNTVVCSKTWNKTAGNWYYLFFVQMISRIEYVHSKGFIHRDLKPDNFLMGIGRHCNKVSVFITRQRTDALYWYSNSVCLSVRLSIRYVLVFYGNGLTYEGRSINMLQNGIIVLIFKIWKFRNIRFVGNLILSTRCEFYFDDITVTSFINIRYGRVAAKSIP